MRRAQLFASLLVTIAVACGGDDGASPAPGGPADDGADEVPDDAPACLVAESYGNLGVVSGTATIGPAYDDEPDGPRVVRVSLAIDDASPADMLVIDLWEGEGPFADGYAPIDRTLAGNDLDVVNCSVCAFIAADRIDGEPTNFHVVSRGQLVVETFDPTARIAGTLTMASFREVVVEEAGQSDVDDGCTTSIDAVSFDLALEEVPLGFH